MASRPFLRMAGAAPRRRSGGFTLTELLIVVAIMGILAAIAAPSMGDMIRAQRLRTASFDVFAALTLARSEAIKRNAAVTILPNSGGANWALGWVIRDANGNVLQNQEAYSSCSTCTMTGPVSVTFASSGRVTSATAPINIASSSLTWDKHRCVLINPSGRAVKC